MKWLARPAAAPEIEPVMPRHYEGPFDDPGWVFEPKYDGRRGLLFLQGSRAWFQGKRGELLRGFDDLAYRARKELGSASLILDGEIVALVGKGREDRGALLASRGELHYIAFDVLWQAKKDLRVKPLWARRRVLERLIPKTTGPLSRVSVVPERGRDFYRAAVRLRLEGIVAKHAAGPYHEGTVWLTIPNPQYRRPA
jgi:bifunctional non-homologous end joining protein LigD